MKRTKLKNPHSDRAIKNCQSKVWYKTEAEAKDAAELRMLDNMSVQLDIYQCNICRNWHLTRLDKNPQV